MSNPLVAAAELFKKAARASHRADRYRNLVEARRCARAVPAPSSYARWKMLYRAMDLVGITPEEHLELCSLRVEMIKTPVASVTQHAVGHGGFHTGVLGDDRPRMRWIYDCGAWRTAGHTALSTAIDTFAKKARSADCVEPDRKPKVDLLYISHFDADHVAGIQDLLGVVDVETVVIPYLEPAVQFAALAEAITEEQISKSLGDAVLAPAEWLRPFGVRRIVRIQPSPENGVEIGEAALRTVPELDGLGDFEPVFIGPEGNREPVPTRDGQKIQISDTTLPAGGRICVASTIGNITDWMFLPHVSPAAREAIEAAKAAIEALLGLSAGSHKFAKALTDKIATDEGRSQVKACYRKYELGDANSVSMSLYVGPGKDFSQRDNLVFGGRNRAFGWILTGDAKLASARRFQAWRATYLPLMPHTGQVMLPHHGANGAYFNPGIVQMFHKADLFLTAGREDQTRPHHLVADALTSPAIKLHEQENALQQISGPTGMVGYMVDKDLFDDWM